MLPKGTGTSSKLEDVLAAGRKYMKHSRFRLLAAGAVVSGILGEVVAAQAKVLHVAAKSKSSFPDLMKSVTTPPC
jgi:hypothetical protein